MAEDDRSAQVRATIEESVTTLGELREGRHIEELLKVADAAGSCLHNGGKLLLFGNGGSASDAQHIAGEFVGRFELERPAAPALALTTDSVILTCVSNDYAFENVFVRQLEAFGQPGDMAIGISTSGRSQNVLNALRAGRDRGLVTVGLGGGDGGDLPAVCDHLICVPSSSTARIQEGHALIGHLLCGLVERELFA